MLLTKEQYERGFLDFDASIPENCSISIYTGVAESTDGEGEWSGPYTEPRGSLVESPPHRWCQLRIEMKGDTERNESPVLHRVRWERQGRTFIWPGPDGFAGPPGGFTFARDHGASYRVVLRASKLEIPESMVILEGPVRIRLWREGLRVSRVVGFEEFESSGNVDSIEGEIRDEIVEGDLIEVVATAPIDESEEKAVESARGIAEACLGLLRLCYGAAFDAEEVAAESFITTPDSEEGVVPFRFKKVDPLQLDSGSGTLVSSATTAVQSSDRREAVRLALRWYQKAAKDLSPVDEYLSLFIGVEALVSSWFSNIDPSPVRPEFTKLEKYLGSATPKLDTQLRQQVLQRLSDFPLGQKFQRYWKGLGAPPISQSKDFGKLNLLRNRLAHGAAPVVDASGVSDVRDLLEMALEIETGVGAGNSLRTQPTVINAALRYALIKKKDEA